LRKPKALLSAMLPEKNQSIAGATVNFELLVETFREAKRRYRGNDGTFYL
jgi:hypothetical protein